MCHKISTLNAMERVSSRLSRGPALCLPDKIGLTSSRDNLVKT
jgi:hypothetical protein